MNLFTKLILSLVCLFSLQTGIAQNFEGTIQFKLEHMLDGKPSSLTMMFPEGYDFSFLGKDLHMKTKGSRMARMAGDILFKGEEGVAYTLPEGMETAYRINLKEISDSMEVEVTKVIPLNEEVEILGYSCKKFKTITQSSEGPVYQYFWITPEIQPDPSMIGKELPMIGKMIVDGMEGFPLRWEMQMKIMGMQLQVLGLATGIEKVAPSPSLMTIPESYEIKDLEMDFIENMR